VIAWTHRVDDAYRDASGVERLATEVGAELARTEIEEFEPGLHAVSAATRDARDKPIAILSVSGPTYRIPRPRLDELPNCCSKPPQRWRPRAPDATGGDGVIREISSGGADVR